MQRDNSAGGEYQVTRELLLQGGDNGAGCEYQVTRELLLQGRRHPNSVEGR